MKLSIVMPYFDGGYRGPLLEKTLDTIATQLGMGAESRVEVVLVEDGPDTGSKMEAALASWVVKAGANHYTPATQYIRLERDGYNNPARAINVGIKTARGEVICLQNPEVFHLGNVIQACLERLTEETIVFPRCWNLGRDGLIDKDVQVYCGGTNTRPFFFCGFIHRKHLLEIGGVDEDYTLPTHDDNDLGDRLTKGLDLKPDFFDRAFVFHQWHPRPNNLAWCHNEMLKVYRAKTEAWMRGEIDHVRNKGREWGVA